MKTKMTNKGTSKYPSGRGNIISFANVSLFLLLYVFLPAIILSVFLLLHVGSPAIAYWISLAVLSGLLWFIRKRIGITGHVAVTCICFLLIVIFAHTVSYHFLDFSYDGMAYHQSAIDRIANGFNPVYDGYMDFGRSPDKWSDQATYFPKAMWYFAASIYAATGDIQLGKAYHLILFFAALFFVLHNTREERVIKRLLWALACLNPIVILQFTGYVVDGALGSLSVIVLFYANLHFSGKPIQRDAHEVGIVSLAMLFCVKTSGFAFGSIIVFCICLQRFFTEYRALEKSWSVALAGAVKLGLRVGIPLFILVAVLGFSPYLTNLLSGRHIFHPLMGTPDGSSVSRTLETLASDAYPNAHNRVTRLLCSIASYPSIVDLSNKKKPAELKMPFMATKPEWEMYEAGVDFVAGGLGPLFFMLLLSSLPFCLFLRGGGNVWLIFILGVMLFAQPYSWYFRYAPFLWMFPFVLCLSTPRRWEYFLLIPILLGVINSGGVAYVSFKSSEYLTRSTYEDFSSHRGEYVLLDKTIFRLDGIFDRFGIKQRFANQGETNLRNLVFFGKYSERYIPGRVPYGSNIAFEADIPSLLTLPVVFGEERSIPWARMSEGIGVIFDDPSPHSYPVLKGFSNYAGRVKFYMRVSEKPASDMEFTLTSSLNAEEEWSTMPQRMIVYANDRLIGEWIWDQPISEDKTVIIPLEVLNESYDSPMNLLILRFDIFNAETNVTQKYSLMFEKMVFHSLVVR